MFLPYGDEPNPERFVPWMTWLLIAVNCAVYFLITVPAAQAPLVWTATGGDAYLEYSMLKGLSSQQSAYDLMVYNHGFRMAEFRLDAIASSLFLHGGLMHLVGNMLFLYIYADNIEHYFGHMKFLAVYLFGGAASCVIYGLWAADPSVPLIGASGAISAVLGLYWILFPEHRIKFFVVLFPFYVGRLQISARWFCCSTWSLKTSCQSSRASGRGLLTARTRRLRSGRVLRLLLSKLERDPVVMRR